HLDSDLDWWCANTLHTLGVSGLSDGSLCNLQRVVHSVCHDDASALRIHDRADDERALLHGWTEQLGNVPRMAATGPVLNSSFYRPALREQVPHHHTGVIEATVLAGSSNGAQLRIGLCAGAFPASRLVLPRAQSLAGVKPAATAAHPLVRTPFKPW